MYVPYDSSIFCPERIWNTTTYNDGYAYNITSEMTQPLWDDLYNR